VDSTAGVIITDVIPFSTAFQREIEPGDIITKMNGKQISTMKEFNQALSAVAPGEQLTMELKRKDGSEPFKVLSAPVRAPQQ
jgi:serine protease Do